MLLPFYSFIASEICCTLIASYHRSLPFKDTISIKHFIKSAIIICEQIESLLRRHYRLIHKVFSMPGPVFEIFMDKAGKHRFHLKASNGEIIASSEAYNSKQACKDGIESVKKNAPIATTKEI